MDFAPPLVKLGETLIFTLLQKLLHKLLPARTHRTAYCIPIHDGKLDAPTHHFENAALFP